MCNSPSPAMWQTLIGHPLGFFPLFVLFVFCVAGAIHQCLPCGELVAFYWLSFTVCFLKKSVLRNFFLKKNYVYNKNIHFDNFLDPI
jgi:hypothetical protein